MGQAKKRGSYEQRKAEAIERNAEQRERVIEERQEAIRRMTPAQRKQAAILLSMAVGLDATTGRNKS